MEMRVLQINTNHSRIAQDLAIQRCLEELYDVICISEPYLMPIQESWYLDDNGVAAIYENPTLRGKINLADRGKGYVAARKDSVILYSCYVSPNSSPNEFDLFLQNLGDSIKRLERQPIIVTGDFHAKHSAWGFKKEDGRGRMLLEWMAQHRLIILNIGTTSTCIRSAGESIVDLSLCSENMVSRIKDWKVHKNLETLSDHRYITIKLHKLGRIRLGAASRKHCYPRWNIKKLDEDLFRTAIIAETWIENREYTSAETASECIKKILKDAADTAMPRVKNNHPNKRNTTGGIRK